MKKLSLISIALVFIGCAHGNCNNVPQRPDSATVAATSDSGTPAIPSVAASPTPTPQSKVQLPSDAVQVSKPTGEKQCGMEKPSDIEAVKTKLTHAKIKVYEAHTQLDGLMHMELCGAPTGSVHVFSISKKDLARAKKLGFKPFKSASVN